MQQKGFSILLLILLMCYYARAEEECKKLVRELAGNQQLFVYCSVTHSVPVNLCIGCVKQYDDMNGTYAQLAGDKNCTDKYFNKDRINIVFTMQNLLNSIWSKAFCDNCFTNNNSIQFDAKMTNLTGCIMQSSKNVCEECLNDYLDLNDFYKKLDPKNRNNICYDIQDAMNRTQEHWSKDLKCCHRERHLTLFLVAISIMTLIPIIFYSSAYLLTKRRERNHGTLNEQTAPDLGEPSTRDMITAAILATPGPMPEDSPPLPKRPLIQLSDSDLSSDEDNALYVNALNKQKQRAA